MSFQAARNEIKTALAETIGWGYPVLDDYASHSNLPAIVISNEGEAEPLDVRHSSWMYPTAITLLTRVDDTEGLAYHRDPLNRSGLAYGCEAMRLSCATFIMQSVEVGVEEEILDDETVSQWSYVRVNGELHVTGDYF